MLANWDLHAQRQFTSEFHQLVEGIKKAVCLSVLLVHFLRLPARSPLVAESLGGMMSLYCCHMSTRTPEAKGGRKPFLKSRLVMPVHARIHQNGFTIKLPVIIEKHDITSGFPRK